METTNVFSIQASAYLSAVKTAARAVILKPVLPALSNLRFEVKMRLRDGGFAVLFSEADDNDGRKIEPKTETTVMLMPVMLD